MAVVEYDPIGIEPAPAPIPERRNVMLVGTLLAIAAGTALVGALLAGYFGARDVAQASNQPWPPDDATLPNVGLLVTYVGLLLSSFTAQWSLAAIKMDDRRQAYLAVGSTLGLGALFLNGMTFVWAQLGVGAAASSYAHHMYAVTVVHFLIVIGAIAMFLVMGFRVFGGQFSPRNSESIAAAVAFWHFAVAAGAVIWWCLWFLEGGPG